MDDRIGQQLGNYRLLQLLGQGGFADVYLGEHIHLHTQAAIKALQFRLVENNVHSFLNEARTIAHLVHPYIIRVLDFGVQDGIPFLVMDYAPKGTFRHRFLNDHDQRLPATPLFPYIKQAAAALQYAHDKKLIHRDVKPENMLLGPNDEVLLSDFGFALIQSSTSRSSTETAGTAAYMAPEQLQGKPRPASDQYALGIIAYEWLAGSCPFHGTFFEIASQHMLTPPPSLHEKVPSLPAEVENVVMTALAKDPDQRFSTVQDFAVALERACLAARTISLDEPLLVPPPFLNEPYKPIPTNSPFQIPSAISSLTPLTDQTVRSTNRSSDAVPSSELDRQIQTKPPGSNFGMRNLSQSGIHPISGEQFSQSGQPSSLVQRNSLSGIRPLPSTPNPLSDSQSGQSLPSSLPQRNSLSGIRPLPSTPNLLSDSQSGQSSSLPQRNSLSGIHPLPSTPNLLSDSQSGQPSSSSLLQRNSLSGIRPLPSTPNSLSDSQSGQSSSLLRNSLSGIRPLPSTPNQLSDSQSGQPSSLPQRNSLSGIRPLPPEQFSQMDQSSLPALNLSSTGSATMMNTMQPSSSQNNRQQSTQSQREQMPGFMSSMAQSRPASIQQSSRGRLRTEYRNDLQGYRRSGTPISMIIFVVFLAILIIGGGTGLIWSSNQTSVEQGTNNNGQSLDQVDLTATASASFNATAVANETATALANLNPYVLVGPSKLTMDDPLSDPLSTNNQKAQWPQNPQDSCQFTNGAYHALAMPNLFTTCFATGTASFTDFTYEIQMIFIKNAPKFTSGGILFRASSDQHQFYFFEVYASGRYLFQKCNKNGNCTILAGSAVDPPSPAYHVGQSNTLAVVAKQNIFTFYINQQPVGGSEQIDNDNPYTQGMIGVLARGGLQTTIPTEVAYNHIRVWQ